MTESFGGGNYVPKSEREREEKNFKFSLSSQVLYKEAVNKRTIAGAIYVFQIC